MDLQIKKQKLLQEYNQLETRQREIVGALRLIEELEKENQGILNKIKNKLKGRNKSKL